MRSVVRLVAVLCLGAVPSFGCSTGAPGAIERATLLTRKGQEDEAARVLREYLAEHPDAVAERRMLVRVLAVTGDLGAARAEAEELGRRLGDKSPIPWIELGHALELAHRYDEALVAYDRAAEIAPGDPAGPREGGMRAARWGEADLAEPRLSEAVRRGLDDARVWHALGVVRLKLDDLKGAKQAYLAGLRADADAVENRIGLATIAVKSGDGAAALAQYDAILARRPKFADGHLGRSWALMKLGRLDDAERAIEEGLRLGADRSAARAQVRQLLRLRRLQKRP